MIAKRVFLAFVLTGMIAAISGAQSGGSYSSQQANEVKKPVAVKPSEEAEAKIIEVNCGASETILKALQKAEPGDTIRVAGTCNERVVITTDRLTLDGQGSAILNGGGGPQTEFDGVVTVKSASGVVIKGLTIQNGPGEGILGIHGASFAVQNTTVQDNAFTGIAIGGSSSAELTDCAMQHNGLGMDVYTGSAAILKGAITITDNMGNGVEVNGQSTLEIRGATVAVNNNSEFGIVAGSGQVAIFGNTEAQGSSITANNNGVGGIFLVLLCQNQQLRCSLMT
jgi:Right handed beta helix region